MALTTRWSDWDGSPLPPDLPGYTGRLAKVVATNTLGQAAGQIANFEIKPGLTTQLVQLPQAELDRAHFSSTSAANPSTATPTFRKPGPVQGA